MGKKAKKGNHETVRCQYHLCEGETAELQCKYCLSFFCKTHIRAKMPRMRDFHSTDAESQRRQEDLRQPGHPCPDFVTAEESAKEREIDRYSEALDRAVSKPKGHYKYESHEAGSGGPPLEFSVSKPKGHYKYESANGFSLTSAIVILLILGVLAFFALGVANQKLDLNSIFEQTTPDNANAFFVRFHTIDALGNSISGATIQVNRTINSSSVTVVSGTTDASGVFSATLGLGSTYQVRAFLANVGDSGFQTIVISTTDYYFILGGNVAPQLFGNEAAWVQWRFEPAISGLVGNTTINFTAYNFTNATSMNLTCFSLNYANGTSFYYINSSNSNGSRFSFPLNANNYETGDVVVATGCYRVQGSSTLVNQTKNYTFFFGSR